MLRRGVQVAASRQLEQKAQDLGLTRHDFVSLEPLQQSLESTVLRARQCYVGLGFGGFLLLFELLPHQLYDLALGAHLVRGTIILLFLPDGRLVDELRRRLHARAQDTQEILGVLLLELVPLLFSSVSVQSQIVLREIVRHQILHPFGKQ